MTLNNSGWGEWDPSYPWEQEHGGGGGGGGGSSFNPNKPQIGLPSNANAGQIGGAINTGPGSPTFGMPSPSQIPSRQGPGWTNQQSSVQGNVIRPADMIQTHQGPTSLDPKGVARFQDPNITWKDRLGRGAKGAWNGYDTGNKVGNALVNAGTAVTGLGTANRVAGAVQGVTSNQPVNRKWTPGQPDTGTSATGSNAKNVPTANQTALQQALSGNPNAPQFHGMYAGSQIGGDQIGGGNYYDQRPPPEVTSPGMPGGTVPPATTPDPDGIEAPKLGTPQGTAALNYLYNQYYGRDATPEEIDSHKGNPGGLDAVAAMLAGDEANHIPVPGGGPAGPGAQNDALKQILTGGQNYQTDGSNGRIGVAGAGGGNYTFAGFDFAQDPANRDIGKSAKYAFSHLAGQAAKGGIPQPRSKEEAQAWFEANIKPGMDALGFTVHKVQGDKAFISAPEHPEGAWVDFQGNSGGQGDQPLAWMAELGTSADADPEAIFAVQDWGGGGGVSGMDRGADGLGSGGVGGVLDSGNKPLDSFAQRLIQQLLEGAALDDAVGREGRTTKGITPQGLASVGF